MIYNKSTNRVLTLLFFALFLVLSCSIFASAELNLGINAHMDSGGNSFSANFRAVTDPDSSAGYDGFDLLTPSSPSDPSSMIYSTVDGNQLAVDTWPSSANPRTLNLTYSNSPSTTGNLVLSWSYSDSHYKVILNDYGTDDTRNNSLESIDLSKQSIASFSNTPGIRYFSLTVTNVSVTNSPGNPSSGSSGGGSGGDSGGSNICQESNLCTDWSQCQNLDDSLKSGELVFSDYSNFKADCAKAKLADKDCGYQTRECNIIDACKNLTMPSQAQYCQYSVNPSCSDGIKNCHDGKCEVLVDCGGPCAPCGSCSNGIKDKGEQGIDCGGVCAKACPSIPLKDILTSRTTQIYFYIGILIILLGILIAFVAKLIHLVNKAKNNSLKWYNI